MEKLTLIVHKMDKECKNEVTGVDRDLHCRENHSQWYASVPRTFGSDKNIKSEINRRIKYWKKSTCPECKIMAPEVIKDFKKQLANMNKAHMKGKQYSTR
jgi:hypothetical protein